MISMASGPRTASNGQIQKRENGNGGGNHSTIEKWIADPRTVSELARALPKHITGDRMARVVLTAIRKTPLLAQCEPATFFGSVLSCAQLGLEPNTPLGHAYLIPRKNGRESYRLKRDIYDCTLLLGYTGMIELARRSGTIADIGGDTVRQGDLFDWQRGTDPWIRHKHADDADREERELTHAYCVVWLSGQPRPAFEVLSRAKIELRRQRSGSPDNGPWVTDFEAMALKSAVRSMWRWLPKSSEIQRAIQLEEAAERGSQTAAWDPMITDRILAQGYELPPPPAETENGNGNNAPVNYDPETGEVRDEPAAADDGGAP